MLQVISQNMEYEWQPIGAPVKRKQDMPGEPWPFSRPKSEPRDRSLKPSVFDQPIPEFNPDSYELAEKAKEQNEIAARKTEILREAFTRHLTANLEANPQHYAYDKSDIPKVVERFINACKRGMMSTESPTFRAVCKELGIKPTDRGMANFIYQE